MPDEEIVYEECGYAWDATGRLAVHRCYNPNPHTTHVCCCGERIEAKR